MTLAAEERGSPLRASHISRGFYIASHKISGDGGWEGGCGKGQKHLRAQEEKMTSMHNTVPSRYYLTTPEGNGPQSRDSGRNKFS